MAWFRKVTDFEAVCHAVATIAGLSHRNPRLLQNKVVPAANKSDIFKCTTQRCVLHRFRNFAKGSSDVPSIPLGRGFVARVLESYESSEHPMHRWIIARTCTWSCKG